MSWYVKKLTKLTNQMTKECTQKLAEIYKKGYPQIAFDESISSQARIALNQLQQKYGREFAENSKKLAQELTKKTDKYTLFLLGVFISSIFNGFSKKITTIKHSSNKDEVIKALIFENVSLIKSIPNEYFKQITGAVARSIENGEGVKWLASELKKYGNITNRRAELIAQDQTRKAFNSINLQNFKDNNIRKAKWLHSGGSRDPREYHQTKWDGKSGIEDGEPNGLDGFIFDIDKPPVIDKRTKERGYPGQLPYCRCVMAVVLDFED